MQVYAPNHTILITNTTNCRKQLAMANITNINQKGIINVYKNKY